MSRLAKKPIPIPEKVDVTISGSTVTVKGPLATLTRTFHTSMRIVKESEGILVRGENEHTETNMHLGTTVSHLGNMLHGSTTPFEKKLIVEGIGFKSEVKGKEMVLSLGFSHPVKIAIPDGLKVTSEKGVVSVSGPDIEQVGLFAAKVRALKKPEPYKGKGIRYEKEVIRRKQGKKTT
ncbi:MAG: 50S ribosomal protein L6 [bacterium]|nr:50S ribosomal protein L6 [bacterium]